MQMHYKIIQSQVIGHQTTHLQYSHLGSNSLRLDFLS